jgi:hypothetical protein
MSITFSSNAVSRETSRETACLCAQGAPNWYYPCADLDEIRDELRQYARPQCPFCSGTGIDGEVVSDRPELNWANANAAIILRVLGLPDEPYGKAAIPEARRALVRARNRSDLTGFVRAEEVIYGQPRYDGAAVELRPVRGIVFGLGEEDIAERLRAFADFVEASVTTGATEISWA